MSIQKTLQFVRKKKAQVSTRGPSSEESGRESRTTRHNGMERIKDANIIAMKRFKIKRDSLLGYKDSEGTKSLPRPINRLAEGHSKWILLSWT